MYKVFCIVFLSLTSLIYGYAQPNANMNTKLTLIKIKMYPSLTHLTWDTYKTCKAYYIIDSIDASKTTLNIIISNETIPNTTLTQVNLINTCKPHTQILKIELKNKSGNTIKTGNYKYDGSDSKPLNGLPKIELIAKPSLSLVENQQSKTYNFETSRDHTCEIISINENFVIGSFYFKDTEGIISGQFKAEIIKF